MLGPTRDAPTSFALLRQQGLILAKPAPAPTFARLLQPPPPRHGQGLGSRNKLGQGSSPRAAKALRGVAETWVPLHQPCSVASCLPAPVPALPWVPAQASPLRHPGAFGATTRHGLGDPALKINTDVLGTEVIVPLLFVPKATPGPYLIPSARQGEGMRAGRLWPRSCPGGLSGLPVPRALATGRCPQTELVRHFCWPGGRPAWLGAGTVHPTSLPRPLALTGRLKHRHRH